MAIACSASFYLSDAQACKLGESQLPVKHQELKNHTENQKAAYGLLPILQQVQLHINTSFLQEASSLHVQQTPPKLAKWLKYLLVNSRVLVENIQSIIFTVCLKA